MKNYLTYLTIIVLLSSLAISLHAQTNSLQTDEEAVIEAKQLDEIIVKVGGLLESKYIDAAMGLKMSESIKTKHRQGNYTGLTYDSLGKQLMEDFREVSDDVHMSAFAGQPGKTPEKSLLGDILIRKSDPWAEACNYGFVEASISPENVGYLKIEHFGNFAFFAQHQRATTNAISMFEYADSLIIDVRGNPGGREETVAYLVSYFFDRPSFHLQEYFSRCENRKRSISTSDDIPGLRLPETPIYILVDYDTGSAAESFAYIMKHLKRATIVGERTVGAGNGSNHFRVDDMLTIQIATWDTINAVTKTSWEKVGVKPDVETDSDAALEEATKLAVVAGKKYRETSTARTTSCLDKLNEAIVAHATKGVDEELVVALESCKENRVMLEVDFNQLGYALMSRQQAKTAEVVLKANTVFYPKSANVYDSYGEALVANEKYQKAVAAYEKAVEVGKRTHDPNLSLYEESLEKLKKRMPK